MHRPTSALGADLSLLSASETDPEMPKCRYTVPDPSTRT